MLATLHVATLPRSLECLPRYMLLRCRDLWNACHVTCCYAPEISGMLATLHVATLPRSLECLPRYMLLRCRELWNACHVTCCYAAEISGMLAILTGIIDAAWTSCKQFIPKALCARHKDLILYAKMWQRCFVNKYKNLLQKTADMLHKLEWKKNPHFVRSKRSKKMYFTVVKTTFPQKTPKFGRPNLSLFQWHKSLPRCGKTDIFLKNSIFVSTVFDPPGCFCSNSTNNLP